MSARPIWERLGLADAVMLAGSTAGAVWLTLTTFTPIEHAAALMLAGLAAVAAFRAMHKRIRHAPAPAEDGTPPGEHTARE
ncbi:hypothetical protein [Actinomadura napierensis]|uniref:Uncharacterized protein n=1 Tax=Actinomadura napierensis TaxID=267854 RepID=A0ABP5M6G6_9ACTN